MNQENLEQRIERRVRYYQARPEKIPGYRILGAEGAGFFGAVLLAEDTHGKKRAIKVPWAKKHSKAFETLGREYQKLGNSCEQIIGYIENVGEYIVMEHCDWPTLKEILTMKKTLPIADALQITLGVLYGLEYAHQRQPPSFHGDVKPSNIKVGPQNQVKLLDFCHAVLVEEAMRRDGAQAEATPYYAKADEAIEGYHPDYAPDYLKREFGEPNAYSDLYMLTKTLHAMIFGHPPSGTPGKAYGQYDDPIGEEAKKIVDIILETGTATLRVDDFKNLERFAEKDRGFQSADEMKRLVQKALGGATYRQFDGIYSKFAGAIEKGRDTQLGINTNLEEIFKVYEQLQKFPQDDADITQRISDALQKVREDVVKANFQAIADFAELHRSGKYKQEMSKEKFYERKSAYQKSIRQLHQAPQEIRELALDYTDKAIGSKRPFLERPK